MSKITKIILPLLTLALLILIFTIYNQANARVVYETFSAQGQDNVSPANLDNEINSDNSDAISQYSNDEYINRQWGFDKIEAPQVLNDIADNPGAIVAILDTGIDTDHEDLAGKVIKSVLFSSSTTTEDIMGHGTHIAGIIAANTGNGKGIAGLVPNCRLLNVKVTDDYGNCDPVAVARGITWSTDNGAQIINISLTMSTPSQQLEEAVNYAYNHGVLIVAAAGNGLNTLDVYPACYLNCMAVAAVNEHGIINSNRTDLIDVVAPGFDIFSTLPGDKYGYKSGNSMAAAFVTGAAALAVNQAVDSNGNGLINDDVRTMIERSCVDIPSAGISAKCINISNLLEHRAR